MFLRAFLSYYMLSIILYRGQQRFHPVTSESALDYLLLRYMRTGLGRKNWRSGFS